MVFPIKGGVISEVAIVVTKSCFQQTEMLNIMVTHYLLQKDEKRISLLLNTYLSRMLISVSDLPQTLMPSVGQTLG